MLRVVSSISSVGSSIDQLLNIIMYEDLIQREGAASVDFLEAPVADDFEDVEAAEALTEAHCPAAVEKLPVVDGAGVDDGADEALTAEKPPRLYL